MVTADNNHITPAPWVKKPAASVFGQDINGFIYHAQLLEEAVQRALTLMDCGRQQMARDTLEIALNDYRKG